VFQSLLGKIKKKKVENKNNKFILVSIPYRDDKNKKEEYITEDFIIVSIPYRDDKNKIVVMTYGNLGKSFNPL